MRLTRFRLLFSHFNCRFLPFIHPTFPTFWDILWHPHPWAITQRFPNAALCSHMHLIASTYIHVHPCNPCIQLSIHRIFIDQNPPFTLSVVVLPPKFCATSRRETGRCRVCVCVSVSVCVFVCFLLWWHAALSSNQSNITGMWPFFAVVLPGPYVFFWQNEIRFLWCVQFLQFDLDDPNEHFA